MKEEQYHEGFFGILRQHILQLEKLLQIIYCMMQKAASIEWNSESKESTEADTGYQWWEKMLCEIFDKLWWGEALQTLGFCKKVMPSWYISGLSDHATTIVHHEICFLKST